MQTSIPIFDFNPNSDISSWNIVDDIVMGGQSNGKFYLNKEGHGVFTGIVSLENNGGFSSVRYRFKPEAVKDYHAFVLRIKGDGRCYQFRVKSNRDDYYSYSANVQTTNDWQDIEIPFSEMFPTFRGKKLDVPNYPGGNMEEISFLIGNKKEEKFKLEIDKIDMK